MALFEKIITDILFSPTPKKMALFDLCAVNKISDDTYNNVKDGDYLIHYYDNEQNVGHISFRPHNGQIGLIYVERHLRGMGLGTQMINQARNIIRYFL